MSSSSSPAPQSSGRERAGFVVVVAALAAMMTGASAPSPFYPGIQERLDLPAVGSTAIFAVYAVALLLALLVLGSLSDHLGRRPVISVGFVLLAVSLAVFLTADSFPLLILARVLQGVASGILLTALAAAITDFSDAMKPGVGAVWNTVAPMSGLAIGALGSGVLLDVLDDALPVVMLVLVGTYLVLAAAVWAIPESSAREAGWRGSLRPRVAVPRAARPMFFVGAPAVFAGWATGGLYLSLGAAIVRGTFGLEGHLWQGLSITVLAGAGAVAAAVVHRYSPRTITVIGTSALGLGTALSLVGILIASFPFFLASVVIVGIGFGTAFMGVLRSIAPLVEEHERAQTFASIFVVSYLAFGIPAVVAGLLLPVLTLGWTVVLYGAVVIVLATVATITRLRSPR